MKPFKKEEKEEKVPTIKTGKRIPTFDERINTLLDGEFDTYLMHGNNGIRIFKDMSKLDFFFQLEKIGLEEIFLGAHCDIFELCEIVNLELTKERLLTMPHTMFSSNYRKDETENSLTSKVFFMVAQHKVFSDMTQRLSKKAMNVLVLPPLVTLNLIERSQVISEIYNTYDTYLEENGQYVRAKMWNLTLNQLHDLSDIELAKKFRDGRLNLVID